MKSTPLSRAMAFSATILTLTLLLPIHAHAANVDALLISTIATGGSAAADEYVVIEAVGAGGAHLADYELIYTTASGATTRRLVSFEGVAPLGPGARQLVANSLGAYAIGSFATWSEGIAATGGALRLRLRATPTEVADAVAWGSAVAAAGGFGTPAPAMSSTTMIDRRRGADLSLVNTQSNSADFSLVPVAPPTLTPISPTPPPPTPTPSPLSSPSPTLAPTPTSAPTATPAPTIYPTPTPNPTPTPTPSAQPSTIPSPTAHVLTPTEARATPVGAVITLRGTISAAPGELAEERLYCLEDPATGAGVFALAQAGDTDLARGDVVIITGTLQMRRQAVTLVATTTALLDGVEEPRVGRAVEPPVPGPWAWEAWEGQTIQVAGTIRGSVGNLAGGSRSLTLRLSGGGDLLVGIAPRVYAQVEDQALSATMTVSVRGVLHQRAGSAGGGYRLWALAVTISRPATPGTPAVSPVSGARPSISPSASTLLPINTPSVAIPAAAQPEWPERLAQTLEVRGGALELIGPTSFSLVVLPRCDEAQAVPREIRARGMVDRAGRAPYPQLR